MDMLEKKKLQEAETAFKRRLLELGFLTKIAPAPSLRARARYRQPIPVAGNAVSETIIKERR